MSFFFVIFERGDCILEKQEFLDALKKDLRFIEKYANHKNSQIKLAAARRLGWIIEFFVGPLNIPKEANQIKDQYQELYVYLMQNYDR